MPISPGHAIQRPVVLSPSNLIDNWAPPYTIDVPPGFSPSSFIRPNTVKTSPKMGLASGIVYKRGLLTTASSQDERVTDEERDRDKRENVEKVHYSLLLLSCMSLSSVLLSLVALVFFLMTYAPPAAPFVQRTGPIPSSAPLVFTPTAYPLAVEIIQEIIYCLDLIVIISSLASFFCSTFQIYFALQILKHTPSDLQGVIKFLRGQSYTRIVVYSFWFGSVLCFIVVIVLTALLSPYRGSISKGVALSAGISALVLCGIAILRSAWMFSRNTLMTTRSIRKFDNYSTLV